VAVARAFTRREILTAIAGAGALGMTGLLSQRNARSAPATELPAFLITIGAFGGASIIDSFLPIAHGESQYGDFIDCYFDDQVVTAPGSNIRAVDTAGDLLGTAYDTKLSAFAAKHHQDMMVVTQTGTSVNHAVGQKRAITGNGAWSGRTLQELVALQYGEGYPMANVNMSSLGYLEHGEDKSLPARCYNEPVSVPALWSLALDGQKGLQGAPAKNLVAAARAIRDGHLDPESTFYQTFQKSAKLARWKEQRNVLMPELEAAGLVDKLSLLSDQTLPLADYGLVESPDAALVRATFPLLDVDPLEAQAALTYMLIKNHVSVAVTIGPSFNLTLASGDQLILNPPLSFDNSHTMHQATQAFMWGRLLGVADRLIDLLSVAVLDASTGMTFWDRTMIYFATEFGRSKTRDGLGDYGSMHHLNNGNLVVSPLANGNRVLGNVDPDTGLTFGFDTVSGVADDGREMTEKEIFAGLVQALGIDTAGSDLPDVPIMASGG
jgi:hypothetical protein